MAVVVRLRLKISSALLQHLCVCSCVCALCVLCCLCLCDTRLCVWCTMSVMVKSGGLYIVAHMQHRTGSTSCHPNWHIVFGSVLMLLVRQSGGSNNKNHNNRPRCVWPATTRRRTNGVRGGQFSGQPAGARLQAAPAAASQLCPVPCYGAVCWHVAVVVLAGRQVERVSCVAVWGG